MAATASQIYLDENGNPTTGNSSTQQPGYDENGNPTTGNSSTFGSSVAEGVNLAPPALAPPSPTTGFAPPPRTSPPPLPAPGNGTSGFTPPTGTRLAPPPLPPPPAPSSSSVTPPKTSLLAEPGAYEKWIKEHAGELDTPTRTEKLYDAGGADVLDHSPLSDVTNTDSAAAYRDYLATHGSVTGAGNSKDVLGSLATGPSNSTAVYNDASGTLGKAGATENAFGEHGGDFDSPGAREAWYAKYGDDPMQKSYTETLYEGGIGQLDPTYDYALQKGLRTAARASNARGQFNSGYAGEEERDLVGNLTGQQAAKWVDLAPTADAARRARYDQGEKFAGDSNADYTARVKDIFGLAKDNDDATNSRLNTLSTIAARGDSADNSRDSTRVTAAGNADRSAADIYNAETDAQYKGSDLTRKQGDQNIDLAYKQDTANRNNTTTKFGLSQVADGSQMGRFDKQGNLMKDLQETGQNRILGGLNETEEQGKREADLVTQVYNDTQGIENMEDTQLQALAEKYGVSIQELNAAKGDKKALVDLFTQAAKLGKGLFGGGSGGSVETGTNGAPIID